ncbi:hypothetical protein PspLS_11851 [Pyricularia sp. CBS 133598]|nr:hypothetical protein PspLS_11851 [Pyricularia sp. CBS 133598]
MHILTVLTVAALAALQVTAARAKYCVYYEGRDLFRRKLRLVPIGNEAA